jgi:thioredoxin 1
MATFAVELTDANFEQLVLQSDKPVLVDFWAQWCGPCLNIAPAIEELAQEFQGQVVIGKLDIDANPDVTVKFGIRSIPTLFLFKNGQVVDKQVGAVPKAALKKKIEGQLVV